MFLQKLLKNSVLTSLNSAREIKVSKVINKSCFHISTTSKTAQTLSTETINNSQEGGTPDKLYRLIEIEVRGNDPAVLKSYAWYATTAANHLGIDVGKSWTPFKPHHERFTVLRSIHVNKKCRVQYEFRTYFHFMQFLRLTGSTADTFLEYIQRNLPEGVAMKVTKCSLESLPEHIKEPEKDDVIEAS